MAALSVGVRYSISSQSNRNDNKSLIFVKLTDSAIRAIEEHIADKNKSQCPSIQFEGNQGHLTLPTCKDNGVSNGICGGGAGSNSLSLQRSNRSGGGGLFKFSLTSSCDFEGPQGSFECIKYTTGQRCVERLGAVPCIMRVQANDDSYDVTRSRMLAEEKKHKENCTRELELDKSGVAGIGRRVKVRPKPLDSTSVRRKDYSSSSSSSCSVNRHHIMLQPPSNTSEIAKHSLRDRIVHLLAVRPYKKLELFQTLTKDGLKDKERASFNNVLMSVATHKDNNYRLSKHVWNDVQLDWPFFSSEDRTHISKRKASSGGSGTVEKTAGSNWSDIGSSSGTGSPDSPTESPVPPVGSTGVPPVGAHPNKRGSIRFERSPSGSVSSAVAPPTKRPRISHYQTGQNSGGVGGWRPTGGGGVSNVLTPNHLQTSPQPPPSHHLPTSPHTAPPPLQRERGPPATDNKLPHPSPPTPPQDSSTAPVNVSTHHHQVKPIHELPKYLVDYTTIKDNDQRRKYKEDFNANYNEYKKLHAMVEKVTRRFSQLDEKLRKEEKGSPNWKRIKDQILEEYHENKKNPRHQDAKRRFHYLHEKLSHIKRLVIEYDSKIT